MEKMNNLQHLKDCIKHLNIMFYELKEEEKDAIEKISIQSLYSSLLVDAAYYLKLIGFKVKTVDSLIKIDNLNHIELKKLSDSVIEGEKLLKEVAIKDEIQIIFKKIESKPSDVYDVLMFVYLYNHAPSYVKNSIFLN